MKLCRKSTTVSEVILLVPGFCADGQTVVRMHREDESPDLSDGFEDSDCEDRPSLRVSPYQRIRSMERKKRRGVSLFLLWDRFLGMHSILS